MHGSVGARPPDYSHSWYQAESTLELQMLPPQQSLLEEHECPDG
jgi:hypothetical protein